MKPKSLIAIILLAVGIVFANAALFIVPEQQTALLLRLGEIVDSDYEPGLHFKMPLIQEVVKFDKRIQTLDASPERFLTGEKKFVVVDSFAKWRIADVAQYFRSTRGNQRTTSRLLQARINSALRDEFGQRTIREVVSGERTEIMRKLAQTSNESASDLGVEVIDVRIKRIDFEEKISETIYERMRTERQRVASELRAQGAEEAEKIRANADRQRTEIMADAYRQSELIRGEGDAESADTYAQAFQQDSDFYAFWRSLTAYRQVFRDGSSLMVLDPDAEFFRYFSAQD